MTETDTRPDFRWGQKDSEQQRYWHHLEWSCPPGVWEYKTTRVNEADHPDWVPVPPGDGWELNVDRWPQLAEEEGGYTRVAPGVLRTGSATAAQLVAHWRRRR